MQTPCEIVEYPDRPVLSERTRTAVQNLPEVLGDVYGRIMKHLSGLGVQPSGHPFVIYYNMDMSDLDVEIGFETPAGLKGAEGIHPGQIPAGKVVSLIYTGPYDECAQAYETMQQFINEKGLKPIGTAIEFYLNDPRADPPPRTRIEMPIK